MAGRRDPGGKEAMPGLYRDRGVVLRTTKLGEADRIVTFLTEGRGKVRAVAKGIRKPKSRFGARLEPTSHVALQLYEGRNLDVVTQVETISAHRQLREGYEIFAQAVAMLEATDAVVQERQANIPLYRMLVGALHTLTEAPAPAVPGVRGVPAVPAAFFWKLLSLEGFHPVLGACARCDAPVTGASTFDLSEGGVLCPACAGPGAPRASAGALDLIGRILGGGLRGVLAEPPGAALADAESLAVRALEHHLERRLRSGAILLTSIASHAPRP